MLFVRQSEVDFDDLRMPRFEMSSVNTAEGLLRTNKMEETLTEGAHAQPATEGNVDFSILIQIILLLYIGNL